MFTPSTEGLYGRVQALFWRGVIISPIPLQYVCNFLSRYFLALMLLKKTLSPILNELVSLNFRYIFIFPGYNLSKMDLNFLANMSNANKIFAVTFAFEVIRYTLENTCNVVTSPSKPLDILSAFNKPRSLIIRPRMINRHSQMYNRVAFVEISKIPRSKLSSIIGKIIVSYSSSYKNIAQILNFYCGSRSFAFQYLGSFCERINYN